MANPSSVPPPLVLKQLEREVERGEKRCAANIVVLLVNGKVRVIFTPFTKAQTALNKSICAESRPEFHSQEYLVVTATLSLKLLGAAKIKQ